MPSAKPGPPKLVRKGAYVLVALITKVSGSGAAMLSTWVSNSWRRGELTARYFGSQCNEYVKRTSAAVRGLPSDHCRFLRSLNVYVRPSAEGRGTSAASCGIKSPLLLLERSDSKSRPATITLRVSEPR